MDFQTGVKNELNYKENHVKVIKILPEWVFQKDEKIRDGRNISTQPVLLSRGQTLITGAALIDVCVEEAIKWQIWQNVFISETSLQTNKWCNGRVRSCHQDFCTKSSRAAPLSKFRKCQRESTFTLFIILSPSLMFQDSFCSPVLSILENFLQSHFWCRCASNNCFQFCSSQNILICL